jgi:osmotically-inducible protein OsmY
VTDQITGKPHVNVLEVREGLMHALSRSWSDSRNITVTPNGATVGLTGSVRYPRDRDLAVVTDWSAPSVENNLIISR